MIGIAISNYNRPEILEKSLKKHLKYLPEGARLIIVDDGSTELPSNSLKIIEAVDIWWPLQSNRGISVVKNKSLELLENCEHIFLFDSDTYPTKKGWEKPYIESKEPHLMYGFESAPTHWPAKPVQHGDLVSWDKPRGCMLYVESRVLPVIGGMHNVYGKHGREHVNWSDRIHALGLTTYPYADVINAEIHCLDEDGVQTSAIRSDDWKYVDESRLPMYAEYREQQIPVLVPRRADNNHRDRVWRFLKDKYWKGLPYRIVEGWHEEEQFNRSHAVNLAAKIAGNWDVAIIADSDAYVDPQNIKEAISLARQTNKLVSTLTHVKEINREQSLKMLDEGMLSYEVNDHLDQIRTTETSTQSLMIVVPRNLWEQVQGFDEKGFVSWGGEDNAFWKFCELTSGEPIRIDEPAYHIWHTPASKKDWHLNNRYWHAIKQCTTKDQAWRIRNRGNINRRRYL